MAAMDQPLHIQSPLIRSNYLSQKTGHEVLLKLDNVQVPGSFKIRGLGNMCQKKLKENPKAPCFVCASGGNAGLAAAYAGSQLKKPVHVFIPTSTPQFVLDQFQLYPQTEVHVHGTVLNEAAERAMEYAEEVGGIMVPPFDHPYIWEGHASLIDELEAQLGPGRVPSCISVSVGGGGLLLGLIKGLEKRSPEWRSVALVAVETQGANCLSESIKAGRSVKLSKITSIAKSLGCLEPCGALLDCMNDFNIFSREVTDDEALDACRNFLVDHRMLVEPACGAALSTIYGDIVQELVRTGSIRPPTEASPAVVIVCGGVSVDMLLPKPDAPKKMA